MQIQYATPVVKKEKHSQFDRSCVLGMGALLLATVRILFGDPILVALRNLEAAALPRNNLVDIHPVKLLEGATLAFNDKEVDYADSHEEASREDVTVGKIDIVGDESCKEADEEIPQPVGCGSQSHTLGTVLGGEELGHNGPDHRTPGHSICRNEQAGHDNHTLAGPWGIGGIFHIQNKMTDRGENHKHDKHPDRANDQRLATTKVLNNIQATKCSAEVDSSKDDLSDEAVRDTGAFEDCGTLCMKCISILVSRVDKRKGI